MIASSWIWEVSWGELPLVYSIEWEVSWDESADRQGVSFIAAPVFGTEGLGEVKLLASSIMLKNIFVVTTAAVNYNQVLWFVPEGR